VIGAVIRVVGSPTIVTTEAYSLVWICAISRLSTARFANRFCAACAYSSSFEICVCTIAQSLGLTPAGSPCRDRRVVVGQRALRLVYVPRTPAGSMIFSFALIVRTRLADRRSSAATTRGLLGDAVAASEIPISSFGSFVMDRK